jgi:hypothetical protein
LGGIVAETNLVFGAATNRLDVTGYQNIVDTVGTGTYALYVGSQQTNQTTGYSNINIESIGDQSTIIELTGQKVTTYDATIINVGIDILVGNNTSFGDNVGLQILNNTTKGSSIQTGIRGDVFANSDDNLGNKIGAAFTIGGVSENHWGISTAVSDGSDFNIGFESILPGNVGSSYGIKIDNFNADSGGGDTQTGGYFNVYGTSNPLSSIKYGVNILVQNDAKENYGLRVSAAGAEDNYSVFADEGIAIFNNSSTTTSDFQIKGGSDSNLFYVDVSEDNIGIGTNGPSRKLDVRGDYNFIHNPTSELTSSVSGYGDIVTFGSGSLTAGDLYYLTSLGAWSAADADSTSSSTGMLAFALGSSPSEGMLVRGYIRNSGFATNTGDIVYISTTAGEITTTAPSSSGEVVRIVGYSIDGTNEVIYFSPDNTWVEI